MNRSIISSTGALGVTLSLACNGMGVAAASPAQHWSLSYEIVTADFRSEVGCTLHTVNISATRQVWSEGPGLRGQQIDGTLTITEEDLCGPAGVFRTIYGSFRPKRLTIAESNAAKLSAAVDAFDIDDSSLTPIRYNVNLSWVRTGSVDRRVTHFNERFPEARSILHAKSSGANAAVTGSVTLATAPSANQVAGQVGDGFVGQSRERSMQVAVRR